MILCRNQASHARSGELDAQRTLRSRDLDAEVNGIHKFGIRHRPRHCRLRGTIDSASRQNHGGLWRRIGDLDWRRIRYMSLQGVPFWGPPLNAQVAPTSGQPCLMQGNSCGIRHTYALRNSFVRGSYSLFDIGIVRAFSSCSEAAGNCRDGLRSQPVRSARERRRPARRISVVCGPRLPLAHLSDLWIGGRL